MGEFESIGSLLGKRRRPGSQEEVERPRVPKPWPERGVQCSVCQDAGYLRREVPYGHPLFGKPVPCSCQGHRQAKALFGDAHIPKMYQDCTFASYLALPLAESQRQAAGQVQAFVQLRQADGYQGSKRGLYLYGSFGTGKSGLAVAALREVIAAGQSGLYVPTYELFGMLRAGIAAGARLRRRDGDQWDREEESVGVRLWRLVQTVQWLVLDDLGVECRSDWVIEQLYALLEERRADGRYTIFTSNRDALALTQKWHAEGSRAAFEDAMRIIERIGDYSVPLYLSGQNLREV